MNDADLDRLEQELCVRLPAEYRSTMRAYPFAPGHEAADHWLPDDADGVLDMRVGSLGRRRGGAPWPAHYVVIGDDGSEERYVLDTSRDPAPVLVFELETGNFRPLAPDFGSYVALLREWQAEIDEDERQMAEREARAAARWRERPWWRFW